MRRLAAVTLGVLALGALSTGVTGFCAYAAAAALLYWILGYLDPCGMTMRRAPSGHWHLAPRGGEPRIGECRSRGRFRDFLWLEWRFRASPGGRLRRRAYLVFPDALGDDDWRRLRRALRIAASPRS